MIHVRFSHDLMLLISRQTVKTCLDSNAFKNVLVELFTNLNKSSIFLCDVYSGDFCMGFKTLHLIYN